MVAAEQVTVVGTVSDWRTGPGVGDVTVTVHGEAVEVAKGELVVRGLPPEAGEECSDSVPCTSRQW